MKKPVIRIAVLFLALCMVVNPATASVLDVSPSWPIHEDKNGGQPFSEEALTLAVITFSHSFAVNQTVAIYHSAAVLPHISPALQWLSLTGGIIHLGMARMGKSDLITLYRLAKRAKVSYFTLYNAIVQGRLKPNKIAVRRVIGTWRKNTNIKVAPGKKPRSKKYFSFASSGVDEIRETFSPEERADAHSIAKIERLLNLPKTSLQKQIDRNYPALFDIEVNRGRKTNRYLLKTRLDTAPWRDYIYQMPKEAWVEVRGFKHSLPKSRLVALLLLDQVVYKDRHFQKAPARPVVPQPSPDQPREASFRFTNGATVRHEGLGIGEILSISDLEQTMRVDFQMNGQHLFPLNTNALELVPLPKPHHGSSQPGPARSDPSTSRKRRSRSGEIDDIISQANSVTGHSLADTRRAVVSDPFALGTGPSRVRHHPEPGAPERTGSSDDALLNQFALYYERSLEIPDSNLPEMIERERAMVQPGDAILHVAAGLYPVNKEARDIWITEASLGAEITLTDLDPQTLKPHPSWLETDPWLKTLAPQIHVENHPVDAHQLVSMFPGKRFDQIVLFNLFSYKHFHGDPEQIVRQMFSLLKPGGRLVLTDDSALVPGRRARASMFVPDLADQTGYRATLIGAPQDWPGAFAKVLTYQIDRAASVPTQKTLEQHVLAALSETSRLPADLIHLILNEDDADGSRYRMTLEVIAETIRESGRWFQQHLEIFVRTLSMPEWMRQPLEKLLLLSDDRTRLESLGPDWEFAADSRRPISLYVRHVSGQATLSVSSDRSWIFFGIAARIQNKTYLHPRPILIRFYPEKKFNFIVSFENRSHNTPLTADAWTGIDYFKARIPGEHDTLTIHLTPKGYFALPPALRPGFATPDGLWVKFQFTETPSTAAAQRGDNGFMMAGIPFGAWAVWQLPHPIVFIVALLSLAPLSLLIFYMFKRHAAPSQPFDYQLKIAA